jgi:hypothetical protein
MPTQDDPYAQIAKPIASDDPYAAIAKPVAATDTMSEEKPSLGAQAWGRFKDQMTGAAEGAANTTGNLVSGTARLLHHIPYIGETLAPEEGIKALEARTEERSRPANSDEAMGKTGEQIAEWMIPTGFEEKAGVTAAEHLPQLARFAKPAAKLLASTAEGALRNRSQGGDLGTGAAIGAGGAVLNEGGRVIAPKIVEKALGVRGSVRRFGATPGQAVLDETRGVFPAAIAEQAGTKSRELTNELERKTGEATAGLTRRPAVRGPVRGLLDAPQREIPLANPPQPRSAGGLYPAARPEVPEAAFSPEARIKAGLSGLSPVRLTDAANPEEAFRYHATSTRLPAEELPEIAGGGVLRTREPEVLPPGSPVPSRYRIPLPAEAPSTRPALGVLDNAIADAKEKNSAPLLEKLTAVRQQLTHDITTGEPLGEQVTPDKILALKRGINDLIGSWTKEEKKGVQAVLPKVYRALDAELDRTVPGADKLNQRISSLIPAERAAQKTAEGGRTLPMLARHAFFPTLGGALGYEEGGRKGAIAGTLGGVAVNSPTGQIAAARLLRSPTLWRLGRGIASQGTKPSQ